MNQEWKEAVDYIEQGKEEALLDMAKVEERQMQPANAILNRTNFYDLMASFTEHPDPCTLHLLLSPQVHRDLSIFDVQALHRAIHSSFSVIEYPLPGYLPSPALWFYAKHAVGEPAGRGKFVKETLLAKSLTFGGILAFFLFIVCLVLSIIAETIVFVLIGLFVCVFSTIIIFHLLRHRPMEEYNVAFLQECPMIDYPHSMEDGF